MNDIDIIKRGLIDLQPQHPDVDALIEAVDRLSSASVRIWHGSFDGAAGTLSHVTLSECAFEDWLLQQVDKERDDFTAWLGDLPADSDKGLDDFLREHCDYCDSWTWDSFDVPVPGIGQRPRIVVALEGGIVCGASSDVPVDMVVIDYDTEGADEEQIAAIPQSGKPETVGGLIQAETVVVDPVWTNAIFAVEGAAWPDGHDHCFMVTSSGEGLPGQVPADIARQVLQVLERSIAGALERAMGGDDLEAAVASAEASFQPRGRDSGDDGEEFTDDTIGYLVRDALALIGSITAVDVVDRRPQLVMFNPDDGGEWRCAISREI